MEVIPYFPSVGVMRRWMECRLDGNSSGDAWRYVVEDASSRTLARSIIAGAHGQGPLLISAAIRGGASVVKRGHPERWQLSDHGRWRHVHIGAIDAAYGATPFFPHLFPELRHILNQAGEGTPFLEFTSRINECVFNIINPEGVIPSLISLRATDPDFFHQLRIEKNGEENDELAFLDVIFRKGPESLFAIM